MPDVDNRVDATERSGENEATREFIGAIRRLSIPPINVLSQARAPTAEVPRVCASLVCTIAELHIAALAVLISNSPSHAQTLVRSMLDAQANLFALLKNPEYLKKLELEAARNLVNVFEGHMADGESRQMMAAANRESIRAAKKRCKELTAEGVTLDSGAERFAAAGLAETYTSYLQMCSPTHNDLNALAQRHMRDGHLAMFDTLPRENVRSICGIQLATLTESIGRVPEFTNLSQVAVTEAMTLVNSSFAAAEAAYCEPLQSLTHPKAAPSPSDAAP